MTATVNMRMPRNFTDMDAKEVEYDGGVSVWGWFFLGCAAAFIGGVFLGIVGVNAAAWLGAEALATVINTVCSGICTTGLVAATVGGVIYGGCELYDACSQ